MDSILQQKIFKKHSKFFDFNKDKPYSLPIDFGIDCGDGWFFIIDDLLSTIDDYITHNNKQTKIKSKFLRFVFNRDSSFFVWLERFSFGRKIKKYIFNRIVPNFKTVVYPIDFKVLQIKEKFGLLNVYTSYEDDVIRNVIRYSAKLSSKVCEYCGTTLNVGKTNPWIITCCKKCHNDKKINLNWSKNL